MRLMVIPAQNPPATYPTERGLAACGTMEPIANTSDEWRTRSLSR